jgi:hypothetical protein
MSDQKIHLILKPGNRNAPITPVLIESLEGIEGWNRIAAEKGRASWVDGALLRPRSRYIFMK